MFKFIMEKVLRKQLQSLNSHITGLKDEIERHRSNAERLRDQIADKEREIRDRDYTIALNGEYRDKYNEMKRSYIDLYAKHVTRVAEFDELYLEKTTWDKASSENTRLKTKVEELTKQINANEMETFRKVEDLRLEMRQALIQSDIALAKAEAKLSIYEKISSKSDEDHIRNLNTQLINTIREVGSKAVNLNVEK